jgi:hypothetical protein
LQNRSCGVAQPVSSRARDFHVDSEFRQHPASRKAGSVQRVRSDAARGGVRQRGPARNALEKNLLRVSASLAVVVCASALLLVHNDPRRAALFNGARAYAYAITDDDPTSYADRSRSTAAAAKQTTSTNTNASIVAQGFNSLQQLPAAVRNPAAAKVATLDPPVRVASRGDEAAIVPAPHPMPDVVPPRALGVREKTALIDFETGPFPYHGQEDRRGHVNSRGSQTYSDDRTLLHIPPGFDPNRPAVMVVFFHGHRAELARDVRDRQKVPAQVTAAGINAVLVAPQFAFDAADSSAGNFSQPNGFKRFLDEAAQKLARLYGDPRSATAFANMPIVVVAYSGGFGPTLAVLERGGVRGRVRGLVLLDALYAGMDKFADWIASNRSAFFVSSYTPHTAYHNADLENLLRKRSVPYGPELRRSGLEGMVTFLPAGAVSHRDFVTHAWANDPVKDILARMSGEYPEIQTAGVTASARN